MPLTRRDFVRNLFVASQVAFVSRLAPESLQASDLPSGALHFAVIGDWGKDGHDQDKVAAQMALACEASAASFVISVGDNFYDFGVASADDPIWDARFEKIYSAKSLQVPWYVILGNHDYRGEPEAQLAYGKTHPRWIMPARYYTKTYPADAPPQVEFFYIDTSPMVVAYQTETHMEKVREQNAAAQLQWLEKALANSTAPWKLVFGHHPIYSSGTAHGNQPELIEHVLPLLEKYHVQAYFAGHDHDLEHLQTGQLNLFISGGGFEHREMKAIPQDLKPMNVSGFAMVALQSESMQVRFIDNLGKLLYTANVPRTV